MRYSTVNAKYIAAEERINNLSIVGDAVRHYLEETGWKPIRKKNIPDMLKHLSLDVRRELIKFRFNTPEFKEAVYLSWVLHSTYTTTKIIRWGKSYEIGLSCGQKKVLIMSLEIVFDYFNTEPTD